MPAAKVSLPITNPKFGYRLSTGAPAVGYKVQSYLAGTTTPSPTYTTPDNGVANANPVILDANGEAVIWPGLLALDLQLQDASGVPVYTFQTWTPVAASGAFSEWLQETATPTYVSATSFTLPGDLRSRYQVGRRIKSTNTSGAVYSWVVSATFASSTTTVTLQNASTTLDSGLSAVSYSLLDATSTSLPQTTSMQINCTSGASLVDNTAVNAFAANTTAARDRLAEFSAGIVTFKVDGDYLIMGSVTINTTGVTFRTTGAFVWSGGFTAFKDVYISAGLGGPAVATATFAGSFSATAGQQCQVNVQAGFSAGSPTLGASSFSIVRVR